MKRIALLGSTGSIGTQALDVISRHPERFCVTALAAHSSSEKLFEQVRRFRPAIAALTVEPESIPEDLRGVQWFFGESALLDVVHAAECDNVLVCVVGIVGLSAVMAALERGVQVLLANKEPLVAGGELVMARVREKNLPLMPIDSEHSAIFQCLQGAGPNRPERLILTASGGPFRTWKKEEIERASREQALRHPNWVMGHKITIDSASMLNKALEVIEARWLFDMDADHIDVLIHPQSIIHSMIRYTDGALIAQLGTPDMRLPILYAMSWPERLDFGAAPLDLTQVAGLTFEHPDTDRFPGLALGYEALRAGGILPAVLNGANEVAVAAFLKDEIRFGGIARLVAQTMERIPNAQAPGLEEIFEADRQARRVARELLASGRFA